LGKEIILFQSFNIEFKYKSYIKQKHLNLDYIRH